ncbi:zinc finger protein 596 isoform 1 [Tropilaelaps mercedesae]|uniref:Zinc finger protein 596 isoform 1 n=1 Tax=Tropilaelaps mercedesae TaxID=418985 RepID=A0A1V9XCB6_9ACAR|nr:zinc finger protein 596 isoform 1 [Tropilaelaps mercedesae]
MGRRSHCLPPIVAERRLDGGIGSSGARRSAVAGLDDPDPCDELKPRKDLEKSEGFPLLFHYDGQKRQSMTPFSTCRFGPEPAHSGMSRHPNKVALNASSETDDELRGVTNEELRQPQQLDGELIASIQAVAGSTSSTGLDFRVGEKILVAGAGSGPTGTNMTVRGIVDEASCTVCGKPFQHVDNLRQHMNAHLGVRPYSCRRCPFKTTHRVYLWRHERQHDAAGESGRDLISCSVCSTISLSDYSRALHQKRCQGNASVPDGEREQRSDRRSQSKAT